MNFNKTAASILSVILIITQIPLISLSESYYLSPPAVMSEMLLKALNSTVEKINGMETLGALGVESIKISIGEPVLVLPSDAEGNFQSRQVNVAGSELIFVNLLNDNNNDIVLGIFRDKKFITYIRLRETWSWDIIQEGDKMPELHLTNTANIDGNRMGAYLEDDRVERYSLADILSVSPPSHELTAGLINAMHQNSSGFLGEIQKQVSVTMNGEKVWVFEAIDPVRKQHGQKLHVLYVCSKKHGIASAGLYYPNRTEWRVGFEDGYVKILKAKKKDGTGISSVGISYVLERAVSKPKILEDDREVKHAL